MPTIPMSPAAISPYGQSPLAAGGGGGQSGGAPSPGNLLMAAAIQSKDPARSMPSGPSRPKFPAMKLRKRLADPLKGK